VSIDVQYFSPSELPVGDFKLNEILRLIIPETHVKFDPMTYIMSKRFREAIKRVDMWSLVDWPLFCEILMARKGDPLDAERVNWEMEVAKCANRSVVVLTAMLAHDNVAAFKLELCDYLTQVDLVNKAEFARSGGKELNDLRNGSGTTAALAVTHLQYLLNKDIKARAAVKAGAGAGGESSSSTDTSLQLASFFRSGGSGSAPAPPSTSTTGAPAMAAFVQAMQFLQSQQQQQQPQPAAAAPSAFFVQNPPSDQAQSKRYKNTYPRYQQQQQHGQQQQLQQ
jgi:hypothetical protein